MLEDLATVERLVTDALDAPKPTTNLTAFKKYELAQVHEFRGRTYDFQRERAKARMEYDTACHHYDEAVKLLDAIPFPPILSL